MRPGNLTQLNFPYLELVVSPVGPAREQIKRPAVLWAGQSRAKHNAEILNVEWDALRERE